MLVGVPVTTSRFFLLGAGVCVLPTVVTGRVAFDGTVVIIEARVALLTVGGVLEASTGLSVFC